MDLYGDLPSTNDGSQALKAGVTQLAPQYKPVVAPRQTRLKKQKVAASATPKQPSTGVAGSSGGKLTSKLNIAMMPSSMRRRPTPRADKPASARTASRKLPSTSSATTSAPPAKALKKQGEPQQQGIRAASFNFEDFPKDEYDPSKPNDYERFCEDRIRKRKDQVKKRKYEREVERQEELRKKMAEERKAEAKRAMASSVVPSGRGRGRGRGRGMLVPAWMKRQQTEGAAAAAASTSILPDGAKVPDAVPGQFQDADSGGGTRAGLGATGSGRSSDERAAINFNKAGIGPPGFTKGGVEGGTAPFTDSVVVLLKNMVAPGEVDNDLQDEVRDECATFGPVEKCLIYEVKGSGVAPDEAVRIFVKFTAKDGATKAVQSLNGRFFDGRKVSATYFDPVKFAALDLAP